MKCQVCKIGQMYLNRVKVVITLGPSKSIIFRNVPVQECQNCGEEFMSKSTMNRILEIRGLTANTEVGRKFRRVLVCRDKKACTV